PGLVANAGFKDHWGRARPREVVEFGGTRAFTPALEPQFETAHPNGSFVCGDGAFGFFFTAFAFVAVPKWRRRLFWAGMGAGAAFSLTRLVQGGHFLSDIIYATFFMLLTTTLLYAVMYGPRAAVERWRDFFRAYED
ncbi:MAG: phosphatase PAP2 family protein, partial [Alphaproteobacteria bacterium]|nr:phosphatase PAP2 family protein [Alphaproteobacteria bacterium]